MCCNIPLDSTQESKTTATNPTTIPTTIFVVSDSHGETFTAPNCEVDVAIHCGDLTDTSHRDQLQRTLTSLKRVRAKLYLAIAGNHDWALDPTVHDDEPGNRHADRYFQRATRLRRGDDGWLDIRPRDCLERREALALFRREGVCFLEEGRHVFHLANGARLCVFASPWTPRDNRGSAPGFRYQKLAREFSIAQDTDIVITHGPAAGYLDPSVKKRKGKHSGHRGCPKLLEAIEQAKPALHVFGHNHDGYGAVVKNWSETANGATTPTTLLDVAGLSNLSPNQPRPEQAVLLEENSGSNALRRLGHIRITDPIKSRGDGQSSTLFVNAALGNQEQNMKESPGAPKRWGFVMSLALTASDHQSGQTFRLEGDEPQDITGSKMTPERRISRSYASSSPETDDASTCATTPDLTPPRPKLPIDGVDLCNRLQDVSIESPGPAPWRRGCSGGSPSGWRAREKRAAADGPQRDERPAALKNLGERLKAGRQQK